ncbi:MAG: flagellar hook-associated protein FlgK, partial [Acidobacteria bacterium]|nr:flagellar hook-associated protein FlgK [Acidobacteriota bacterium]
ADKISQIAGIAGGPDKTWSDFVVTTGVNSKAALQQSVLSDNAHTSAVTNQQSVASVDLDEENMNMLQYQHAYQAAARVMTAVDETLDVLINQTGRVGR